MKTTEEMISEMQETINRLSIENSELRNHIQTSLAKLNTLAEKSQKYISDQSWVNVAYLRSSVRDANAYIGNMEEKGFTLK